MRHARLITLALLGALLVWTAVSGIRLLQAQTRGCSAGELRALWRLPRLPAQRAHEPAYDEVGRSCSMNVEGLATPGAAYRRYRDALERAGWHVHTPHAPHWTTRRPDRPDPPPGAHADSSGELLRAERDGMTLLLEGSSSRRRVFLTAHVAGGG